MAGDHSTGSRGLVRHMVNRIQRLHSQLDGDNDTVSQLDAEAAELEAEAAEHGLTLPLLSLERRFGLNPVDLQLLLLGVAPQVGPWPIRTVDECLVALVDDVTEGVVLQHRLLEPAPLIGGRLLELTGGPHVNPSSWNQHNVLASPRVAHYLSGRVALGPRLQPVARVLAPDERAGDRRVVGPTDRLLRHGVGHWIGARERSPLAVSIHGDAGSGKSSMVGDLARYHRHLRIEINTSFLHRLDPRSGIWAIRELFAAAVLFSAWLVFDDAAVLPATGPVTRALCEQLDEAPVLSFLLSTGPLPLSHPLSHRMVRHLTPDDLGDEGRLTLWQQLTPELAEDQLDVLSPKFDLGPAQVRGAVRDARFSRGEQGDLPALERAAYRQYRGDLSGLARQRVTRLGLPDLLLPAAEKDVIREIIRAAKQRAAVLHKWGFKHKFDYGTGIVCLFSGEPGTGKTLSAQIIASELGLDLFQVAIPQVVSKWVGETEKQIARIFSEARASRAVLLFDEADSLLGARTEVRTASDRYANMSTNYLLQEIEAYDGLVILTTNLEQNLDAAAQRRILFRLQFPFPGPEERAELWERLLPEAATEPTAPIDFHRLGHRYELSGGHIKNALLRAAYGALDDRRQLAEADLMASAERECRTLGKLVRSEGVYHERM